MRFFSVFVSARDKYSDTRLSMFRLLFHSNYPSGQMHEIGHNLGFAHSGESQTYDDQSGMMGYSYSDDEGPVMVS